MTGVLVIKGVLLSLMWTFGWCLRFIKTNAEPTVKNLCIMSAPWILAFLYILFFWW